MRLGQGLAQLTTNLGIDRRRRRRRWRGRRRRLNQIYGKLAQSMKVGPNFTAKQRHQLAAPAVVVAQVHGQFAIMVPWLTSSVFVQTCQPSCICLQECDPHILHDASAAEISTIQHNDSYRPWIYWDNFGPQIGPTHHKFRSHSHRPRSTREESNAREATPV